MKRFAVEIAAALAFALVPVVVNALAARAHRPGARGGDVNLRELCRFCNRKVDVLPSGRLAYHHYVAPGIGIPCPGMAAENARLICPGCARPRGDVGIDWYGRLHHHYIRPGVSCRGVGKLPEIAA